MNNEKQSLEFVLEMRQRFNQPKFFIEFTEIFDNFRSSNDPDLNNMFLFAEEAFNDKKPIWFVLSILIANFGKMLIFHLKSKDDAYIFEKINNKTSYIVSQQSLDECIFSYGYNEYLYHLLLNPLNKNSLSKDALHFIRYKNIDNKEDIEFNKYFKIKKNELNWDKMKKKYIPLLKLYFKNNGLYM